MDLGKSVFDKESGGGYDLSELKKADEALRTNTGMSSGKEFEDVEPMYIEVLPNARVARTEEFEARVVVVEYDEYDNIVGVELL